MNKDNIIDKLREIFGKSVQQLNILEEKIDIGLQMEYFEQTKVLRKELDSDQIMLDSELLYNPQTSYEEIKNILVQLAGLSDVKALRKIEEYKPHAPENLHDWVTLALHESKMNIESVLLDKNLIYISTGLGGKEGKLRYFIVLSTREQKDFTTAQKSILEKELKFSFDKQSVDLENINFEDYFVGIQALIPLQVAIKPIFAEAIDECNQMGNFLNEKYLITNVKVLSKSEIESVLHKKNEQSESLDLPEISDQTD